jgi:organic hydroperoxide reductase OsmC/OhrA
MQGFPHHYLVSASGGTEGNVVVSGEGLPDLDTQGPPQFGGPEGIWSPETMLTGAVANCFILSFRAIARASKFEWTALQVNVDGILDRPERATYFTGFNIHAVLDVADGANVQMAERLLEKAEKICLVTASMKSEIVLTTEIRIA